jgi:hypothetical protein
MWTRVSVLAALIASATLCGCIPKRINWSHDGEKAAVIGEEGLYLCDAEGQISDLLVPDVVAAEWLPDDKRLALVMELSLGSWKSIEEYLSGEEQKRLRHYAGQLCREVTTLSEWEANVTRLLQSTDMTQNEVDGIKHYIIQNKNMLHEDVIGTWGKLNPFGVSVIRLARVNVDKITLGAVVRGVGYKIWEPRVSPDGTSVAWAEGNPFMDADHPDRLTLTLWMCDLDKPDQGRMIARHAAMYPDWSPDSRHLIYARSREEAYQEVALGAIYRLDANAALAADEGSKPSAEPLVGIIMDNQTRIRCLDNGCILFTAIETTLPLTLHEFHSVRTLFAVNPGKLPTVVKMVQRRGQATHDDSINYFEVSPDQSRVCFPLNTAMVGVLDLTTGSVELVQQEYMEPADDTLHRAIFQLPVWRHPNQLCYARPVRRGGLAGFSKSPSLEVVLQSLDADGGWEPPRVISKGWPRPVKEGWLNP